MTSYSAPFAPGVRFAFDLDSGLSWLCFSLQALLGDAVRYRLTLAHKLMTQQKPPWL